MNLEYIVATLREIDNYYERASFASALAQHFRSQKVRLSQKDREMLTSAVFDLLKNILIDIKNANSYKEKYDIFNCEASLMDITAYLYPNVNDAPEEFVVILKTVFDVVTRERFLENAIMGAFEAEQVTEEAAKNIISLASNINDDEFHRGQLFVGLYEYREEHNRLTNGAKEAFAQYIESEFKRFSEMKELPEGAPEIIEIVCDIAKHFKTAATPEYIIKILSFGVNTINYYAVETLLSFGCDVPQEAVNALAHSLRHADGAYSMLERYGKTDLFPQELATPEYLAKSDMVQWLCYPTELGKEPDEIELLGDFKVKGERYFVFIYKSNSDTLDDEHKNVWLIGWSGSEGGTFSNFDKYEDYDKGKTEKTLKYIKKKIIG